jgi:hypothetical protein
MSINPNREGLKALSDFSIDSQFISRIGNQVFNYQGESTPEFQNACAELLKIVNDTKTDLDQIISQIPISK